MTDTDTNIDDNFGPWINRDPNIKPEPIDTAADNGDGYIRPKSAKEVRAIVEGIKRRNPGTARA